MLARVVAAATLLSGVNAQDYNTWSYRTLKGAVWPSLGGSGMRWGRTPEWTMTAEDATASAIRVFDAETARNGDTGTGEPIIAQPIIAADGTIYARAGGRLFAFEGGGGSCPAGAPPALVRKWSILVDTTYTASAREPRPERVSTPTLAFDGTIILGSMDGHVYAVHPNGTLRWKLPLGGPIESSPVIGYKGLVAIGCNDNSICAWPRVVPSPR